MSSLVVEPVTSWWQRRQFIQLPWEIYRGNPYWIPPLISNLKEMLNYKHSAFWNDASIQTFLAKRDGRVVGRIAAIIYNGHNRRYNEKRGFCGFFECEDNQETANALFNTAKAWLAERGMTAMRGPASPSMNHECGLLIEGFDHSPTFMNAYNPEYYERLWEGYGFRKAHDMFAFWGDLEQMKAVAKELEPRIADCRERFKLTTRPFDLKNFNDEVRVFLDVFNQAYAKVWGFVPLSDAETDQLAKGVRPLIVPELTTIAEINGKAVGTVLAMLDYNPRIKQINGRLFPFGFIRLLANKRAIKRIRVMSADVIPKYHRWGIGLVVVAQLLPAVQAWGIDDIEFSWVLESNHLSFNTLKGIGAKITKKYRMYDVDIV